MGKSISINHALPACPICGGCSFSSVLENCRDIVCGCPGNWSLVECNQCNLIFTLPQLNPEKLLSFYPPEYGSNNPIGELRSHPIGNLLWHVAMLPYTLRFGSPDWADEPFNKMRLLDIGCGAGMFLKKALNLGWNCFGIDINPIVVQKARINAPGAKLWAATLNDLGEEEKYDLINISHVLEHLPNPYQALNKCFCLLNPKGKMRICVPNIGSAEAKAFGRYWRGLDVPRHLAHFRPDMISHIMCEIGFANINIRPQMLASSISESITLLMPKSLRYRFLNARNARLLYLSLVFPASLSYMLGNAGSIEVTANRP